MLLARAASGDRDRARVLLAEALFALRVNRHARLRTAHERAAGGDRRLDLWQERAAAHASDDFIRTNSHTALPGMSIPVDRGRCCLGPARSDVKEVR